MKNILLFITACLAFLVGNAQNQIVEAEYYLDQDPGFGNASTIDLTTSQTVSEAFSSALGDLEAGTYFAYVRVKDENDMWSVPLKVPFHVQKSDLPDISAAEWFLGDDPGFGNGNPIDLEAGQTIEDLLSASTEGLPAGRNFAYLRFQNADGTWSVPLKKAFMINDKFPLDVVAAEYFIDEDPGIGSGISVAVDPDHFIDESYLAEVAEELPLGDHFLYTRVQNENGDWSINIVRTFTVGALSTSEVDLLNSTSVYPNPARDFINVKNERYPILEVRLFDMTGRAVESTQLRGWRVDLSQLSAGTYLLNVKTEAGSVTRKIVVE